MKTKLTVVSGDFVSISCDALLAAIRPGDPFFGTIAGSIRRVARDQFHVQARAAMPLEDGDAVIARRRFAHRGAFTDVVFIVDTLRKPLADVMFSGLRAAHIAGCKSVVVPAMRMSFDFGVVEKSIESTMESLSRGLMRWVALSDAPSVETITVVVNNLTARSLLEDRLL